MEDINRRNFFKNAAKFTLGRTEMSPLVANAFFLQKKIEKEIDIKSLFISNREDVLVLTTRVFQKCILEKIFPPSPPMGRPCLWLIS